MSELQQDLTAPWLAVTALATWRVTAALCYDRGPFAMLVTLRRLLARAGASALFTCFHCAAVWVALLVAVFAYPLSQWSVLLTLALAGAASILERLVNPAGAVDAQGGDA